MKKFYPYIKKVDGGAHICYVSLCMALTAEIVLKRTSALRTQFYRTRKILSRKKRQVAEKRDLLAKLQAFTANLAPDHPTIGQGSNPLSPPVHQTGDPKSESLQELLRGLNWELPKSSDKTAK
jgi:hypothetical protein